MTCADRSTTARPGVEAPVPNAGCDTTVVVRFTPHAITRYIERAAPGLDRRAAERALIEMAAHGHILGGPPLWLHTDHAHQIHLVLADVCFPLDPETGNYEGLVATTCKVRGWRPEHHRGRHARRRGQRRGAWRPPGRAA